MELTLLNAVEIFKSRNRLIKSRCVALSELSYTHPAIKKILAEGVTRPKYSARVNRRKKP